MGFMNDSRWGEIKERDKMWLRKLHERPLFSQEPFGTSKNISQLIEEERAPIQKTPSASSGNSFHVESIFVTHKEEPL